MNQRTEEGIEVNEVTVTGGKRTIQIVNGI